MRPILLDTCAAIWLAEGAPISKAAQQAIAETADNEEPLFMSPITAWEIGLLVSKERLKLSVHPQVWFERVTANTNIRLTELSGRILIASSFLPGEPPNDPADRIVAATARENGFCLMTRDRPLLKYAGSGHINALAC
jgi:PIN domain nuclease of toxin-antitoxin system